MQDHRSEDPPTPPPGPASDPRPSRPASRSRSPHHQALGEVFRLARARLHISQEALGDRTDLHRNYVGAIERGELNPTFQTMLKLARGVGVPLSELIGEVERRVAPG
jgi:DNA-binding XRE family transcriptional regulator